MLGYRVPAPNEAMLISGGKQKPGEGPTAPGLPFRIVTGHGASVLPFIRKASFLSLSLDEAQVLEECVSQQGISLKVRAVIAFKVGSDVPSIAAAAQRFLSDQDRMSELTGQIFAGHLRSIIGSMTVENIIRNRQELAASVLDASKIEMANMGLVVDSLQIQSIDDLDSGYIKAMSAPYQARIQQEAKVAQAAAEQVAVQAQQDSARNQAEFARVTAVARAQYQAEIDQAQRTSEQAGPLAQARAAQEVLQEQAKVAGRNAELRQAQLIAEVLKPAAAEAERLKTIAVAQAEATALTATAAATEGRIALEQAVIAQLPELVKQAARGLAGANLTVLNGADGVDGLVAGMVGQGTAMLRTIMSGLDAMTHEPGAYVDVVQDEGATSPGEPGETGG